MVTLALRYSLLDLESRNFSLALKDPLPEPPTAVPLLLAPEPHTLKAVDHPNPSNLTLSSTPSSTFTYKKKISIEKNIIFV